MAGQSIDVAWQFHPRQSRALDVLADPRCEQLLYGGAKGGGKTVLGVRWCFLEAVGLIDRYGLSPSQYPLLVGFIGRQQGVDLKKTTLETWKEHIPEGTYRIDRQEQEIVIGEAVKLAYGAVEDRSTINKFNSMELVFAFIDQAEEVSQDVVGKIQGTLRRKISGQEPAYKMLLTANPAACWLKPAFIKNSRADECGRFFVKALPADNPYLATSYFERLRLSYGHRPELLAAYVHGEWDALEGSDLVIQDSWVRASHSRRRAGQVGSRVIAADISRFGDDRTVMYYMEDTAIVEADIYGQRDCHYTAGKLAAMANGHQHEGHPPLIVIDGDGLGGPVADDLRAWGFKVVEIHSAAAADEPEVYENLRAQMWWEAGKAFSDGAVSNPYIDEELDLELTVPKYRFRNGRIVIESKEEIKKPDRYGRSPDKADAYVYGLYGRRFYRAPKAGRDAWKRKKGRNAWSA